MKPTELKNQLLNINHCLVLFISSILINLKKEQFEMIFCQVNGTFEVYIFFLQNTYAPDADPEMTVEQYERSYEQNEDLGLNDMKTENYEVSWPAHMLDLSQRT